MRGRSLALESWIALVLAIAAAVFGVLAYTASFWVMALVYETAALVCLPLAVVVWTFGLLRRRWARRRKP